MSIEVINQLKRILRGVTTLQGVIFNHHTRHEAGGGDEVSIAGAGVVYNTFSGQDSLDATYPFELLFEIVSEMTAIQSVKLSFKIRNYRAYAKKELPLGGHHTTDDGGETTTPSGGEKTTPSGGQKTSGSATHSHSANTSTKGSHRHSTYEYEYHSGATEGHVHTYWERTDYSNYAGNHYHSVSLTGGSHTHTCPNHTHTCPAHSHTCLAHHHDVKDHIHTLAFGIYEKEESPAINIFVDNGKDYSDTPINDEPYTKGQTDIDITEHISGTGLKQVKFTSDKMTGIAAHVLCKVALAT